MGVRLRSSAQPPEHLARRATVAIHQTSIERAPLPAPRLRARKKIVVPAEPLPRRVNHGLILAIARAKTWMQGLRDGKYQDTAAVWLSDPDFVEAIVEGRSLVP
jgi:hypothetical protein